MPSRQDYLDGRCDEKGLPLKKKRGRPKKVKESEDGSATKPAKQQQLDSTERVGDNNADDRPNDTNRSEWWEDNG